jgi:hypothetical protein
MTSSLTVPHSFQEAEHKALSDASRECIARSHLYEELEIDIKIPIILIISVHLQRLRILQSCHRGEAHSAVNRNTIVQVVAQVLALDHIEGSSEL